MGSTEVACLTCQQTQADPKLSCRYTVNYASAGYVAWGAGGGCLLATGVCSDILASTDPAVSRFVCDTSAANSQFQCTYDRKSVGYCASDSYKTWDGCTRIMASVQKGVWGTGVEGAWERIPSFLTPLFRSARLLAERNCSHPPSTLQPSNPPTLSGVQ